MSWKQAQEVQLVSEEESARTQDPLPILHWPLPSLGVWENKDEEYY